jgi:hypothetical protein
MRTATFIFAVIAMVVLAGCDNSTQPSAAAMLGYQVDAARERSAWLTREGVQIHSAAARPVRIELPGWIYAGAPYCPPGIALGPKGEVVVTSNVIPTLWRIDGETLAVTTHPLSLDVDQDKDVGFAAVIYAAEEGAFIAYSQTQRSVWKIDASLKAATRVAAVDLDRPAAANGRLKDCASYARRLSQPRIEEQYAWK